MPGVARLMEIDASLCQSKITWTRMSSAQSAAVTLTVFLPHRWEVACNVWVC